MGIKRKKKVETWKEKPRMSSLWEVHLLGMAVHFLLFARSYFRG